MTGKNVEKTVRLISSLLNLRGAARYVARASGDLKAGPTATLVHFGVCAMATEHTLLPRLLSIRFKSLKPSTVQANSKFGLVQTSSDKFRQIWTSSDMSAGDYDYNDTSTAYTGTVVDYDLEDRIVRINGDNYVPQ